MGKPLASVDSVESGRLRPGPGQWMPLQLRPKQCQRVEVARCVVRQGRRLEIGRQSLHQIKTLSWARCRSELAGEAFRVKLWIRRRAKRHGHRGTDQ